MNKPNDGFVITRAELEKIVDLLQDAWHELDMEEVEGEEEMEKLTMADLACKIETAEELVDSALFMLESKLGLDE